MRTDMLKIHLINTPILREDLSEIESDYKKLKQHHKELHRLCKEKHGVGVSANQVGLRENFFFVTAGARFPSKSGSNFTAHMCINPTWEPHEKSGKSEGKEGCLSLPGRDFIVERHGVIEAEWTNAMGHRMKKRLKNWAARVFQHEADHLRGVTLIESGEEIK